MKKSIFGLLVLGACHVAAHAQSSVSLYGILDVAVRRDSDLAAGKSRIAEVGAW